MAKSRCQLKCFEFSEKLLHFHVLSALKHQFFLCYCFQLNKVKERNIRSICRQQLFRSLRAHQYSSDQMKILKDQSAQTTARVVSVAYCLWLPFLINRVLNLTILHPRNGVILYILPLCTYLSSNFIFVVPTLWKQQRLLTFRGI